MGGLALLACAASAGRSAAAERPVVLAPSACEVVRHDEVEAILRVELLGRLASGPSEPPDADRAAIVCSGDLVTMSVVAPRGGTKSSRADLAAVPANVRARIVALAIAELVRDVDREPPPAPASPPPVSSPTVVAATREHAVTRAAPRAGQTVGLAGFAQASRFPLDGVWLMGGGLRFDYAHGPFCAGLDAVLLGTSEAFPQGAAHALLAYGSPYVAWQGRAGPAWARVGAGYALGVGRLSGQSTDPRASAGTTVGLWTAPYGLLAMGTAITDRVGAEARGQLGWVTSSVVGEVAGASGVALQRLWASLGLGVVIAL